MALRVLLALALLFLTGCGADPALTSIQILPGPGEVILTAQAQTAQFQAIGTYSKSNQTKFTRDITREVTWLSVTPAIATINSSGVAAAVSPGVTDITATLDGIVGESDLFVEGANNVPVLTISVVNPGSGAVVSTPGPINCATGGVGVCAGFFTLNATVTLTATPNAGSTFGGWSANCQPTNAASCTITLTSSGTVTAIFNLAP